MLEMGLSVKTTNDLEPVPGRVPERSGGFSTLRPFEPVKRTESFLNMADSFLPDVLTVRPVMTGPMALPGTQAWYFSIASTVAGTRSSGSHPVDERGSYRFKEHLSEKKKR